jgi:glycosyltransferase involved in cell wall biosynthesis
MSEGSSKPLLQVLFVGHEASRTGAPIGFLSLMTWLKRHGGVEPVVWLRHGGDLAVAHREVGPTAVGGDAGDLGSWAKGVRLAYLNTATLGVQAEILKSHGIPVICHVHEMDFELELTGKANLQRLKTSVSRFVACSEAVRRSVRRCLGVPDERIVVVPECVDVERALRLATERPAVEVRVEGKRVVCGMGTVSWRKGVDLFLRVVAELGDGWVGVWIGDLDSGPDAERIRHDLRVLGLEGRVRFTGSLANPYAVLAQTDVFCLTSREDPYPLAMVEAVALGKPLIGFRGSGGVEEFAGHGAGWLVDYGDTHGMAVKVRQVAGSGDPVAGEKRARALCDPDVVGRPILRLIEECAAAAPVALTRELQARLMAAAGGMVRVAVGLRRPGDGDELSEWWEGPANGVAQVEMVLGDEAGREAEFEVVLEPQGRSLVMADLEVAFESPDAQLRECRVQVRSAGRVVRLSRDEGGVWLLLDGHGRLIARGVQPASAAVLVIRWHHSTDVKQALAGSLAKASCAVEGLALRRSIWQRLGLKK